MCQMTMRPPGRQGDDGFVRGYASDKAAYERGQAEGYKRGQEEGYERGYEEGREVGFEEGREKGFEEGREEGFEEGTHDRTPLCEGGGRPSGRSYSCAHAN